MVAGSTGFSTPAQSIDGEVANAGGAIEDLLDDLEDAAEDSVIVVDHRPGPLPAGDRILLDDLLTGMLADIDQILDPGIEPNLSPATAGGIDVSLHPESLDEYASVVAALAAEAHAEFNAGDPVDYELIGSNLKTIEYLILRSEPHNYRSKAGL